MKPKRNYLLFLCLFFLKGYGHAMIVLPAHSFSGIPVQITQFENPTAFDHCQKRDILECTLLFGDDDDDDSTQARKRALISRYSTLHTIFLLRHLSTYSHNSRRSNECFGYLSPGRCIFQRVLRV